MSQGMQALRLIEGDGTQHATTEDDRSAQSLAEQPLAPDQG